MQWSQGSCDPYQYESMGKVFLRDKMLFLPGESVE